MVKHTYISSTFGNKTFGQKFLYNAIHIKLNLPEDKKLIHTDINHAFQGISIHYHDCS